MTRAFPPAASWTSALIAAVIGFGGTVALIVQAMRALGASVEQTGSSITALCLGIAVVGALLSLRLRMPIVLAWSTPGAALLAAGVPGTSWSDAVGAFIISGLMMVLLGAIPALGRLAEKIPASVASGMLAGILLPFCLALFQVANADPLLTGVVVGVFLIARLRLPLYALLLVLVAVAALTLLRGQVSALPDGAVFGVLAPVVPSLSLARVMSIAVPLFLVTLMAQNLPGLVVLRSSGYDPGASPLLIGTGLATAVLAPFGAHAVNLAAITAALCTSDQAHPDRARRWVVGMLYAGCYLLLALFAPLLVRFFLALPHDVIAALAGVSVIPALIGSLETALAQKGEQDAAIVTFLAAGSGLTLFGLGGAFWGLIAGVLAIMAKSLLQRKGATGS
ncbi:benzoate/H(+) symporter BenE family transporter [Altererythrobacter xixiisoli]|uniref:Benzoate/H(+) symporter BenE family transporter n=1 Tax=Croceibacterium xixiisoli TaxID=1476466 RepID=A0A6I4TP41_9SPHN|nr:benzoate/H(+) symporter BenE family transporter [Croceibacterium xixiisoli]